MKSSKVRHIIYWALALLLLGLNGCSPSKFIAEGEYLYRGSEIVLSGPGIPMKEKRLTEDVTSKLQPKPNKKFLGLFYSKIWMHEKVTPKEGKEKGLKYWMKNKLGEKPILVSGIDTDMTSKLIQKLIQDQGLFHTSVTAEVISHRRQAKIHYLVDHSGAYKIGLFRLPGGLSPIDSLVRSWDGFSIKTGNTYRMKDLKDDREKIAHHIRSQGYFDFYDKNILFLVDTSYADKTLAVDLRVKAPTRDSIHRKYYIRNVNVYPTHRIDNPGDSLEYRRTYFYKGLNVSQYYQYIGRKALHKIILLEPGQVFSVSNYDISVNRLINTGIFRYVNINYTKTGSDSLDVDILLTPANYQGVKVDVEATTSNRSFLGTSLALSYTNGNLFRGAERFSLKASVGTEFQIVNDKATMNILNVNLEARLEIPGLIEDLRSGRNRSEVMPRGYIELVENFQKWLEYYTMNSLRLSLGYEWQAKEKFNHRFEALGLEWVTLLNTTSAFDEELAANPQLKLSFNPTMILGPSYSFNVTSRRSDAQRSYIYYSGSVETAGNLGYLIGSLAKPDQEGPYELIGVPMANFVRLDNEVRHYWDIKPGMSLVSRIGVGMAFAYGNSEVLPYIRQFSMGGPNTLRAFQFRSVGPGSYAPEDEGESNQIEQAGDLQIMMNLEYRFTIYRFLRAAIFVDAGNVWLRKQDPDRPGGEFDLNRFYKEIALGTGFGIRLDFDFFALRVDMGIPVYKPFNEDGQRWIPQFPEEGFKNWRKTNWAWNIAIGYPF